jgi:hypothetical protein
MTTTRITTVKCIKRLFDVRYIASAILWLMALSSHAAQIVTPQQTVLFVTPNESIQSQWLYGVSAPESNQTVGLGLRVHYNAQALKPLHTEALIGMGVQPFGLPQADLNDWDNDPHTDTFIVLAWLDFAGEWPAIANLPTDLFKQLFTLENDFQQYTRINLTASSTAGDAVFNTQPQHICQKPKVSLQRLENASVLEGESIALTIQLDQALPIACGNILVNYQLTSDEQNNINFNMDSSQLIIPAGQQSTQLTIQSIDNAVVDSDKTMIVQLQANAYTDLSNTAAHSQIITLKNDDSAVSIQASTLTLNEGQTNSTQATITVQRVGYLGKAYDVTFSLGGSATQQQDYNISQLYGRVSFAAQQAEASFTITSVDDNLIENTETILLSLAESSDYQLQSNSQLTLSIRDNDEVCFDLDGNGQVDALTDGITLARYLLGLRGEAMIKHSLALENTLRDNAIAVTEFIEKHLPNGCYDIDDNQRSDALTDGILLLRYLSDYQGEALIQHVLGNGANRTDAQAISDYLHQQLLFLRPK